MKKSITGYKKNSKDKNEPILEIPSSNITMRDVLHPVFSIGTQGVDVMEPGQDYKFNTGSTIEIPYKQLGGFVETGLPAVNSKEYQIKKGDTLGAIAKKYNISVSELSTANNIANPNKIKENQKIIIPVKPSTSFSKKDLQESYKTNKPVKYDDKKLYKGLDESKIDNHQVILDYYKKNKPDSPYTVIDKKTNILYQYDEDNNLINQFRVGLGKDQGDQYTINSKNKQIDRNTSSAGIYRVSEQNKNESYQHEYDNNIVLLENERGMRQAMSIHQLPNSSKKKRQALLENNDLTDDDFSNGCVNCTKEQFEKYNKLVTKNQPVYVLPEEDGNFFTVKDKKLAFTTNKNKNYGQYNYTPKSKESIPLNVKSNSPTDYKNQFINALTKEKSKLQKDLNLSSDEYDELAKRAYGIFGQESSFGEGSWNPSHNYKLENLYTALFDTPEERQNRSLGLTQIRPKHINPDFAKKYGINSESLNYPYQSAIATMERLADSLQSVKQSNVRDKYKNMTPENVYDYATTFYNKPETVRAGKASGNNTYVQNVNKYAKELDSMTKKNKPENKKMLAKYQKGGTIKEFESYLSSLEETDQDELLDYMETMDYENQQEFLKGGRVQWESYQKGGVTKDSIKNRDLVMKETRPMTSQARAADVYGGANNYPAISFSKRGSGKTKSRDRFREKEQGGLIYQDGGETSLVPVEVEGKETIVKPNGELYKFEGPKHKHGGIDILAEPGSKIFSHHSKAPQELIKTVLGKTTKKKMSYADISKKFDTTKWSKVLQNPDSDEYQKKTAELKMSGNLSMLETIFQTQEEEKEAKGIPSSLKARKGLDVTTQWDRTFPKFPQGKPQNADDWNVLLNGVPGEFLLPQEDSKPTGAFFDLSPSKVEPPYRERPKYELAVTGTEASTLGSSPNRRTELVDYFGYGDNQPNGAAPVLPAAPAIPTRNGKPSRKSGTSAPTITKAPSRTDILKFRSPDEEPPEGEVIIDAPNVTDRTSIVEYKSQFPEDTNTWDATPKEEQVKKKKGEFGIDSKLAGTVLDIGLALSDNINVKQPNLWDLRKNPLFTRFVDFDDKEAGRNLSLSIQQIQNSNMPEDVKQARIADMNAQYQDHTAKVAFGNAQRYESKLNQDTEKLQTYINNNIDQHHQDVERYNQQKAHVDYLRDQFTAQRKSRVVNSMRNYLDYVDRTYKQNKLLSENYEMNPFSGKINFKGNTKDVLKQKESEMAQYKQNSKNAIQLPNGASMTMLNDTTGIVTSSTGSIEIVKLK